MPIALAKHKLLRVHLTAWLIAAEQSKIKTGAGKIKAGYSLAREQPAGQVNKFFGESIPIVLRKPCRVFAALHRQKKRKAIILYLRCFARGRKRDYYINAPRLQYVLSNIFAV